jgi:hypothetical protein
MTTFQELDQQLAACGWRYDVDNEVFTDGSKRLGYQKVLALVPGMTLEELASYQDDQLDRAGMRRHAEKVGRTAAAALLVAFDFTQLVLDCNILGGAVHAVGREVDVELHKFHCRCPAGWQLF